MKKSQQQNQNNIKSLDSKRELIEKVKNESDQIKETPKKSDVEKQKELELKSKTLNKPKELIEFDALSHFKENIAHTDKNFLGSITENSYYCIACQHSECPLYKKNMNQKDHLLIKKIKYLFYNNNFFDEIDTTIKEALTYNKLKDSIKSCVTSSINSLKDELDKLKEKKFQEIDVFFEETDKYLSELKNKYINVRQSIEDYYKVNKKFFNIEISKGSNTDKSNVKENKNVTKSELTNNNLARLSQITLEDIENGQSNKDIENTVFLLNFELMNLCDTKNLEIIHIIKNLKNKIDSFNKNIQKELITDLELVSGFFDVGIKSEKIDDYYWDVVLRAKKYSEIIQQFRETITDIYHQTGNLEKIKDLIDIFDSKLKKNNKIIYEQKFFKDDEPNNKASKGNILSSNELSSRKRNPSGSHKRTNSRSRLLTSRGKSVNKLRKPYNETKGEMNKNEHGVLTLSNDVGLLSLQKNKNDITETRNAKETGISGMTSGNLEHKKTSPNSAFHRAFNFSNCVADDIILDQRVIERFFAYSISELYSKNFIMLDSDDDTNYTVFNKDNIYLNRNTEKINKLKNLLDLNNKNNNQNIKVKTKRSNSMKKYKNLNSNNNITNNRYNYLNTNTGVEGNYNNLILNNKNLGLNNINNNFNNNLNTSIGKNDQIDTNQYNIKSVSYLSHYSNRYNSLKERAKPLIGTNQIQLFSPINQRMIRKITTLNKDEHGYNLFPEGCRHILIEDNLYIIGGTNHVRLPISIVLVYNILTGVLKRLPDLNTSHSYHSVEYLENFDSILCIGGENSSSCEIMNLENNKWFKLPNLNIPRANCNIYFNSITSELFVLFGICGIMSERINNYCDSIEVLVINDLSQGWLKVDYYKTPGLNLKVNYCMTLPFTRNQLVIYGGSNMRTFRQSIFALFHMLKSECIKVDTQTMELIKLEEKKSRLVDLALTKLG